MSRPDDLAELKRVANLRMGDVLARLKVDARPRGGHGTILMSDPMSKDNDPSFVIWTNRPGGLSWKRYGMDAQGDIINLVSYLNGWWWLPHRGTGEAIRWLKDVLDFRRLSDTERRHLARRARIEDAQRAKRQAEDLARWRRWALAKFLEAEPVAGTPGETYLRERRGINLQGFPIGPRGGRRLPQFLRFLPLHTHHGEDGRDTAWPCLIACCVDPASGEIQAVHRTWITRDGRDKAPVDPPRKCFPSFAGLVIPVWKGGSNMTVAAASKAGLRETLCITEGWEDGLAWAFVCPDRRVWAAISLSNVGNIKLPDIIDSVSLHRQNDWSSFAAMQDFEKQKAALERQGRPVLEMKAYHGKDLSDTLRGAA